MALKSLFACNTALESRLESRLAAKVLLLLEHGASGKAILAENLGHKMASGELHKQIKRLMENKLIEMTIPKKPIAACKNTDSLKPERKY